MVAHSSPLNCPTQLERKHCTIYLVGDIARKLTNLEDADKFVFVEPARGQSQGFHANITKGECCKAWLGIRGGIKRARVFAVARHLKFRHHPEER